MHRKPNARVRALAALYSEHPWVVEWWNPVIAMWVDTGCPSWAAAMKRCATYSWEYASFDGYEKPRIKATGLPANARLAEDQL